MSAWDHLEKLGWMFYAVSPNKTSFENIEDVPEYMVQAVPYYVAFFILEAVILILKGGPTYRINDTIGSLTQAMLYGLSRIFFEAWKVGGYIYVYNNWRLVTLPWDSLWTWWIAFFFADFIYYWGHRALHEINFLWAAHQVHHSSEDFNMTTALRQSVLQYYLLLVFYFPMALIVPPSAFLVHSAFNLLYQVWIHTQVVGSIGPLEYILNTASHHRVHHGKNRYCIDKNYGGTLIIWDRLFGTFEAEKEQVFYGLTHPINTFEPFYIQFFHFVHIGRTFWDIKGWKNKLSVIFKGPGCYPGTSRNENIEDIPDVSAPVPKYDPPLSGWLKLYASMHFILVSSFYIELTGADKDVPRILSYSTVAFEVLSAFALGILLEGRTYASWLELVRCVTYVALDVYFLPYTRLSSLSPVGQSIILTVVRGIFVTSTLFWLSHCVKSITITSWKQPKKID